MIRSFRTKETKEIWEGYFTKLLPRDIQAIARRKLRMLNNSKNLTVLKVPPGNRLEALKGDRKGRYSIRINNRWRIYFQWKEEDSYEVEIVDYHK